MAVRNRDGGHIMFVELLGEVSSIAKLGFKPATAHLTEFVNNISGFIDVLEQIGTIPESLAQNSTEEKLFAKASEIALARAFRELGLDSTIIEQRGNAADVFAESHVFGYKLVADAKTFRMSRTAKNQKDNKIVALSEWRNGAEYAVLCSPLFQYPKSSSQIFSQSLKNSVCLISWEHIVFMLKNGIRENEHLNLSQLWNFGSAYRKTISFDDGEKSFLTPFTQHLVSMTGFEMSDFRVLLERQISIMEKRSNWEIEYWEKQKELIQSYSKADAIAELIKAKKIDAKIRQIEGFVKGLHYA